MKMKMIKMKQFDDENQHWKTMMIIRQNDNFDY